LREGDEIAYSIEEGRVVLTRATTEPADDPFHSFTEWNSEADRRAYADL
jgi:antitoxin PrlF